MKFQAATSGDQIRSNKTSITALTTKQIVKFNNAVKRNGVNTYSLSPEDFPSKQIMGEGIKLIKTDKRTLTNILKKLGRTNYRSLVTFL
jgi:hypothetical protein